MKKSIIVVIIMILLSGCKAQNTELEPDKLSLSNTEIESYISSRLPIGEHSIDIMDIGLPTLKMTRLQELTLKIQQAAKLNEEWFVEYTNQNQGSVLPYHENLGITKEEYEEFFCLTEQLKLHKVDDGTISIKHKDKGNLVLESNDTKIINNLEIDLINNEVITEYGKCIYAGKLDASDEQNATGRWSGYEWKDTNEGDFDFTKFSENSSIKNIHFYVGQFEETQKTIIYYQVQIIEGSQTINEYEFITIN